jgi:hypothetical protein
MTLRQWADNGWLKPHQTSAEEIRNLLSIVRRDLQDAQTIQLSADWRFGIAYNAALKLCTALIYASGYRPDRNLAHYRTLQSLHQVLGEDRKSDAAYLDACRIKRNTVEYDLAGAATDADATELISFVMQLEKDVVTWLQRHHPGLFSIPKKAGRRK